MATSVHCHANNFFGADMLGKRFELQQDLFLYQRRGPSHTTLSPPGWTSDVPPSIGCYLADPDNWMNSAEARSKCVSSDIHNVKILAVLPEGTHIRVERFKKRSTFVGTLYTVFGTVENSQFSDREVRFFALFDGTGGNDLNFRPKDEFLLAVSD